MTTLLRGHAVQDAPRPIPQSGKMSVPTQERRNELNSDVCDSMNVIQPCDPTLNTLPEGFIYVEENCYFLAARDIDLPCYLYSDSATSCVILILEGTGRDQRPIVALTHLSSDERFQAFFDLVDRHFCGATSVFALGANPPSAALSLSNSQIVLHWILSHTAPQKRSARVRSKWSIDQITLAFGLEASEHSRNDCVGIDVQTGVVSTQAYALTAAQRDPTSGVQALFSMFGLHTDPPMLLHNSAESFRDDQIAQLVEQAERANWTAVLGMTDAEILASCSSTPDHEVPWFCEALRTSARYTQHMMKCQE